MTEPYRSIVILNSRPVHAVIARRIRGLGFSVVLHTGASEEEIRRWDPAASSFREAPGVLGRDARPSVAVIGFVPTLGLWIRHRVALSAEARSRRRGIGVRAGPRDVRRSLTLSGLGASRRLDENTATRAVADPGFGS